MMNIAEQVIAINFISLNPNITYPIACKYSYYFKNVVEKLYQECSELRTKNIYFLANGNVLDKEITIGQNKIKGEDTILIEYN